MVKNMFQMLFDEAPAHAVDQLWTPRRRVLYVAFAIGPSIALGTYLYTVKVKMDRMNEEKRLLMLKNESKRAEQHYEEQTMAMNPILEEKLQEFRDRISQLELQLRQQQQQLEQKQQQTKADDQTHTQADAQVADTNKEPVVPQEAPQTSKTKTQSITAQQAPAPQVQHSGQQEDSQPTTVAVPEPFDSLNWKDIQQHGERLKNKTTELFDAVRTTLFDSGSSTADLEQQTKPKDSFSNIRRRHKRVDAEKNRNEWLDAQSKSQE